MKTRPLYGMDLPRRELTDPEKDAWRAQQVRECECSHTWARHILWNVCAGADEPCTCRQWRRKEPK